MVTIQENVPLAPLTTFHVGGRARYFAETTNVMALAEALEYAHARAIPVALLGGGSNVIFPDAGFSGLVIRLRDSGIYRRDHRLLCGASATLFDVVRTAAAAGLAGIERLAGIPGSMGGAIRGNAGAFGTEIGDVTVSVKVFVQATGLVKEYRQKECDFAYRTSRFKRDSGLIILSAELALVPAERATLERLIDETVRAREAKHPQQVKCAGSFFINPIVRDEKLRKEFERDTGTRLRGETVPAGWLIDHVGLRGKKIGGAMISERHPNYLLNIGHATAEDVFMLASLVKTRVRDELRVKLDAEVQFLGF